LIARDTTSTASTVTPHNGKIGQEELKYPLMSLDGVHIAVVRRPQPTFTGELLPEPNLPFVRI
jgi:hypothetical protein